MGYTSAQMAELTEISEELYRAYESGSVDLPFTFIHKCAKAYGIEIIFHGVGHVSGSRMPEGGHSGGEDS